MSNSVTDKSDKIKTLKLMLIGEAAVGKSSIMYRYTMNSFKLNMLGTAGIDFKKKEVEIDDNKIKIILYDTAGHDRFRKIMKNHCKGANGIVLVYDIGEEKSIERLSSWMNDIKENSDPDVEVILVGNKADITQRKVTEQEGLELSMKFNIPIIETSAKTGQNVEEAFNILIKKILTKEKVEILKTSESKEDVKIKQIKSLPGKKKDDQDGCKCIIF